MIFSERFVLEGFNKLDLEKGTKEHDEYVERARHELKILKDLGFIDYVLLVWDVINYCHRSDIPTGSRSRIGSGKPRVVFDWRYQN